MGILDQPVARVLVLGVGNVLLGDDGLGPVLVRQVQGMYRGVAEVECLDGGTQGLALLGYLAGREVLVVLDAFSAGKTPGEVSVWRALRFWLVGHPDPRRPMRAMPANC
jgi:hydrogenase maturation protease